MAEPVTSNVYARCLSGYPICAGCFPYVWAPNGPIDHEPGCTAIKVIVTTEYEHTCCKCKKKFTAPTPPTGLSFCDYGCT